MKKNKETYLIILDTNMVYYDSEDFSKLFNSNAKEILNFLKVNKISQFFELCIPQVVLEERITQRIKQVEGKIKKIKEGKDTLKEFIEISLTNEKDIKIILETKAKEFVNKNKILVFEYPKIEQKIITKEACEKKEPFFNQDKQEYKDKIIWETLKENAKNDGKNYLFLTNNKSDFNIELLRKEFEKFSPKKLEIFQDIKSLKLYLEKEFNLGTHLKEIYSQKEKEIRANTNKILYSLTGERKDFILYDKNLILANALIEELRIENISENFLYANIKLRGKAKFIEKPRDKEEESIFPFANRSYSEIYTPRYTHFFKKDYEEKDVEIKFVLNLRDYSLENISILEGSYLSPFSAGGIE